MVECKTWERRVTNFRLIGGVALIFRNGYFGTEALSCFLEQDILSSALKYWSNPGNIIKWLTNC